MFRVMYILCLPRQDGRPGGIVNFPGIRSTHVHSALAEVSSFNDKKWTGPRKASHKKSGRRKKRRREQRA